MRKTMYDSLYPKESVLKLLRSIITSTVPRENKVYTSRLICWLMVGNFLHRIGGLAASVLETYKAGSEELIGNCRRARKKNWSRNTSALSQARMKVPLAHFQGLLCKLQELIRGKELRWHDRLVFGVDGTTITTQPTDRLRKKYRPNQNQYGQSPFPVVNVTVAHDLLTGLALEPEWDPMYGDGRQSELEQTLKIFPRLENGSVVVSDRAHGVFFVSHAAVQNELDVVYRLTDSRAKALLKVKVLSGERDQLFEWKASGADRKKHPELAADASIRGRIIIKDVVRDNKLVKVILFTTLLDISAKEIVELYGKRWQIEGDIRDLKKTLLLDQLSARTPQVLDREILAAVIAYNIVRTMILFAAQRHGIADPRRIGFKNAVTVLRSFSPDLMRATSKKECLNIVDIMLEFIAVRIDKKRNRRSFPCHFFKHRTQDTIRKLTPIPKDL